jgi:hypothetical protein
LGSAVVLAQSKSPAAASHTISPSHNRIRKLRAGAQGQSTNFIDPSQTPKTIADHVAFARDFLQPFGCTHYKANMGQRPPGGPSDDQLKRLADTLNEIGRQTIAMGIRMAPHPHILGPIERESEVRRMMELTDP